ncbi:hypothetical protein SCP_0302690 [Sparassis crispa]|uniref:Uncharacterized protein n=1 Tax=Sparassis crispa TaxID=139825 RepID=A0A401GED7_9APHY|nr:hypothetical protein SCP_0302690 [Sparassis crispa]GBE80554.1 hypothetical protein SCP_0302690 [Sparassis crispa]
MAELLGEISTDAANLTIMTTGTSKVCNWLSRHTTESSIVQTRKNLHEGMEILYEAAPHIPRQTMKDLIEEHDILLAQVDQIELDSQAPLNVRKRWTNILRPLHNNSGAHTAAKMSTRLVYKIRRSSDIAKSMRLSEGGARSQIETFSSNWSIIDSQSTMTFANSEHGLNSASHSCKEASSDGMAPIDEDTDILYDNPWNEDDVDAQQG